MFCVQLGYNEEICQYQANPHPLVIDKESHMTDQEKIAYLEQALREKDHELMRARQEFSGQIAANDLGDASLRHRIELAEQELGFMRQQLADKDAEIDRLTKVVDTLQGAIATLNGSGTGA